MKINIQKIIKLSFLAIFLIIGFFIYPNITQATGEWCERCSANKSCTRVRWFDSDGGCDNNFNNQRREWTDNTCTNLCSSGQSCNKGTCITETPRISLSPNFHNFGSIQNLNSRTGPSIRVTNTGNSSVDGGVWDRLPFFLSGGTHNNPFYACSFRLGAGQNTNCSLVFIPSSKGDFSKDLCFEAGRLRGCNNFRVTGTSLPWTVSLTATPRTNVNTGTSVTLNASTFFEGTNTFLVVRIYEGEIERCEGYSASGSMNCSFTTTIDRDRTFTARVERRNRRDVQVERSITINTIQAVDEPQRILPSVSTHSATNITTTAGTLNGHVNPQGSNTQVWFEYGFSTSLGNSTSRDTVTSITQFNERLTGLLPNTTYHFRAIAENSNGRSVGEIRSFVTGDEPQRILPSVSTHSATNITTTAGTLNGHVNPQGSNTQVWFEYGFSTSLGNSTSRDTVTSITQFNERLTGLLPNTTYHFRAIAENSNGRSVGEIRSFVTGNNISPNGWIECDSSSINSITLRYDYSNGRNVSLFRGSNLIASWNESRRSGTITDNQLMQGIVYRYELRNGNSPNDLLLDSVSCQVTTAPPSVINTFDISILKQVRSITRNTSWQESITVSPGERIAFSVRVGSVGNQNANNVNLITTLPNRVASLGNIIIDGVLVSGNLESGLNIGNLQPGESKTITFEAVISSEDQFGIGSTNLIVNTSATSNNITRNDNVGVFVGKGIVAGAATAVATGITNNKFIDFILLPFLLTALLFILFRKYFIVLGQWLEERKISVVDYRSRKKLDKIREIMRTKESIN